MPDLPGADEVFLRYFAPWYDADDLARRGHEATRPDVEQGGAEPDPLLPDAEADAAERVAAIAAAARGDWADLLGVAAPLGLDAVDAFDRYYDRARVAEVLADSDPADFGNELLVLCCEFGAVLGELLRAEVPGVVWRYDWPYWESGVLEPSRGYRVNVFHWAIRKFSADGVDDGYRAKVLQCRTLLTHGWS
jgi:hypothetical protein